MSTREKKTARVNRRRRLPHPIGLLPLLIALACVGGCGERVSSTPRLVLLYAPCTVGKQFLSPWDPSLTFTPNLSAFAAKSTVFARHQTESGQSGISYASLFSGSQADHHRVFRHPARLSDDLYLIGEAYADAGYETFFWNGHPMTGAGLNYAQGIKQENHFATGLRAQDARFVAILDRLARDPEYKAFVVTNFTVTHGPYSQQHVPRFMEEYPTQTLGVTPADVKKYAPLYRKNHIALTWNHQEALEKLKIAEEVPEFARTIELLYRANINYLDTLFGNVHDAIVARDLMDESLIAFTADHGEVLFRESATFNWTHSMLIDHQVLGVPLMIYSPRLPWTSAPHTGVTRSIDVFPTMAGLSNVALPADRGIRGVDLSANLISGSPAGELLAYSHTSVLVGKVFKQMYQKDYAHLWAEARKFFPDERVDHIWVAVRSGDDWFKHRKLENGSWATQAFKLASDPEANRDIFDAGNPRHAEMHERLLAYKQMLVDSYGASTGDAIGHPMTDDQEEGLLRDLGYIE